MEALWVESGSRDPMEPKWKKVLILSLVLHLAIFSIILFAPEPMTTRRISGAVYEVNLVEMPKAKRPAAPSSSKATSKKRLTVSKKAVPAKRISRSKKEKTPIVIGKKTIKRKRRRVKTSPSKLIDRAVAKIERKVRKEKSDHVNQAISKLETRLRGKAGRTPKTGGGDKGIIIRIYQMEVEQRIKSNWSYPVALLSPESRRALEAIVVIKVKSSGKILKFWVMERSSDIMFDQSVIKAVERSDPLPPFPEGYRRTHDEIEINFNLRELEGH